MSLAPTCAGVDGAELPLDRPIWTGDVAPRPLGGVRVPAVAVISDTSRGEQRENVCYWFCVGAQRGLSAAGGSVDSLMINTTWEGGEPSFPQLLPASAAALEPPQHAFNACCFQLFTCLGVGMDEDVVISGGVGPVQARQTRGGDLLRPSVLHTVGSHAV